MQMAELSLLPAVRKPPDAIVVADGTSCRHQIQDGAQREAVHAAVLLARSCSRRTARNERHNDACPRPTHPRRPALRRSRLAPLWRGYCDFYGADRAAKPSPTAPGSASSTPTPPSCASSPRSTARCTASPTAWCTRTPGRPSRSATWKTCSSLPVRARARHRQGADRVAAQRHARRRLGPPVLDDARGQREARAACTTSSRRPTASCATCIRQR